MGLVGCDMFRDPTLLGSSGNTLFLDSVSDAAAVTTPLFVGSVCCDRFGDPAWRSRREFNSFYAFTCFGNLGNPIAVRGVHSFLAAPATSCAAIFFT